MSAENRRSEILRRKDTRRDLMQEVLPYIAMTPERRDFLIQQTARLAAQLARDRGSDRSVCRREPLPESSARIWRRLSEEYRRGRTSR